MKNAGPNGSFFDEDKVISANKFNFYSLMIGLFVTIPFVFLFHDLTAGFGIGEITFLELAKISFTGKTKILHVRNIIILLIMVFFVLKSYLSKEEKYKHVNKKGLVKKWILIIIPFLITIPLYLKPKILEPSTSMFIALLMILFYNTATELLLMKFMKGQDV